MDSSSIKPLVCGLLLAGIGAGVWFSFEPASSQASTTQDVTSIASEPVVLKSDNEASPSGRAEGGVEGLRYAVDRVQERQQSLEESARSMSDEALHEPTKFRRLSLAVEGGVITTKMEEVTATLKAHRRFMERSAFRARRVKGDATEGVGWLRYESSNSLHSASGFAAAVNATIEIAYVSEMSSHDDPANERQHERRVCELIEIAGPYLAPERAKRLSRARKECASLDD